MVDGRSPFWPCLADGGISRGKRGLPRVRSAVLSMSTGNINGGHISRGKQDVWAISVGPNIGRAKSGDKKCSPIGQHLGMEINCDACSKCGEDKLLSIAEIGSWGARDHPLATYFFNAG